MDRLRLIPSLDFVVIGEIPDGVLMSWPRRTTHEVVVTRERMEHYLHSHPEMASYETGIIETLLDPDEVHKQNDATAVLFRRQDDSHDLVAVVSISSVQHLKNSLISARRQRAARKLSPSQRMNKVWSRG